MSFSLSQPGDLTSDPLQMINVRTSKSGRVYSPGVLLGNWFEDVCLEEVNKNTPPFTLFYSCFALCANLKSNFVEHNMRGRFDSNNSRFC